MNGYGTTPLVPDVDRAASNITRDPDSLLTTGDVGIFKSTILPSFAINSGLSVAGFIAGKATDRGELKDWCWPSSQVTTAWWSAIGHRMYHDNIPFTSAWNAIPWTERVLLSCVTAWGTRLFYRIASRSISRGKDDPRYDELKKQDQKGFWKSAFFKLFAPEVVFLTLIQLPFTLPFQLTSSTLSLEPEVAKTVRAIGVGLFSAGFALEALADAQLASHRKERSDLCRHGVWSIVRHPNYLGDAMVHFSFVLLNAATHFNPVVLLGPVANYLYLRFIGGDKQTEASQEERYTKEDPYKRTQLQTSRELKNSFWPSPIELVNPWTWVVVGGGLVGVAVEEFARNYFFS